MRIIILYILKEINLRLKSYPFDWVTKIDHLYDTNIMYNISLINCKICVGYIYFTQTF